MRPYGSALRWHRQVGGPRFEIREVLKVCQSDPNNARIGFWAEHTEIAKMSLGLLSAALEATRGKPGGIGEEKRKPADRNSPARWSAPPPRG